MNEYPNSVLIVVDQWRRDCPDAARHPVIQTPHLDRLARDGVRVSRAYATTPCRLARFTRSTNAVFSRPLSPRKG